MDLGLILNQDEDPHREAARHARDTNQLLAAALHKYDQDGGSAAINVWELRQRFAQVVPFTDPLFIPRFSDFALSVRELDKQHNRPTFAIGGLIPRPDIPVVLPQADFRFFQPQYQPPPGAPPCQQQHSGPVEPRNGAAPPPLGAVAPPLGRIGLAAANALRNTGQHPIRLNPLRLRHEDLQDAGAAPRTAPLTGMQARSKKRRPKPTTGSSKSRQAGRDEDLLLDESSIPSDKDDSDNEDPDVVAPCNRGTKQERAVLPPKAQKWADDVELCRTIGFSKSVEIYNQNDRRQLGFPFSMVQTLIRGHYVCAARAFNPEEYKARKAPKPTDKFVSIRHVFPQERDWRNVVDLIASAIIFAFLDSKPDVDMYFKHIGDMVDVFAKKGDWSQVVNYDARLRILIATRPALTFCDFNNNKLLSARSVTTVYHPLSTPAQRLANTAPRFRGALASGVSNATPIKGPLASSRGKPSIFSAPKAVWHGEIKPSESLVPNEHLI